MFQSLSFMRLERVNHHFYEIEKGWLKVGAGWSKAPPRPCPTSSGLYVIIYHHNIYKTYIALLHQAFAFIMKIIVINHHGDVDEKGVQIVS